jgi:opacity protein-like surface antigen
MSLDDTVDDIDELTFADGWGWGARGGFFITERLGLEAFWTLRETPLDLTSGTSTAEVLEMSVNLIHANVVYQFGASDARLTPFVFGGGGAAILGSDDIENETKFSWDVGAGVKWFFSDRFGLEGRLRYNSIELGGSTSDDFCGPFGFCQGALRHVEIATGVVVRF